MTHYKPDYFRIEELVPPELFHQFRGRQHIVWQQLDARSLYSLDRLREIFGPAYVNTWLWGGRFEQSGLRTPNSQYYSPTSQHSHGRGFDVKFRNEDDYDKIRHIIVSNPLKDEFRFITCIEKDTPTWLHIDCRIWDKMAYGILQVPYR